MRYRYDVPTEAALQEFAMALSRILQPGSVLYLSGPLGAGKTTLVRSLLASWGITDTVKSPTYTLVEPYVCFGLPVYHFDLYRLGVPEELEYLGGRDYFTSQAICLVEWPEKGQGHLPLADLVVEISFQLPGRCIELQACTPRGAHFLGRFCYEPASQQ